MVGVTKHRRQDLNPGQQGTNHRRQDTSESPTTLVLGGTGKTGRRIVARLQALGCSTRVGSRSGEPPFDWQDQTTWPAVLPNVRAVYISFYPDLAVPGAADSVGAFAALAADRGVGRLVLLSGRGEPEAQRAEALVREAGPEWTVVRSSWFSQNFSESFLLDDVRSGVVALPVDGVREPFVDVEDIVDVAVAALTGDGHAGRVYEVTGPRLLTFAQAVREIAAETGREVRFEPLSMDEYTSAMTEQNVQSEAARLFRYLFTEVLDGRNSHLSDGVQSALGRPPRDFRAYVRAAAGTGVWAEAGQDLR